jgi:hypothetical protein
MTMAPPGWESLRPRPTQVTKAVRLLWTALLLAVLVAFPQYLEPLPPEVSQKSLWMLLVFVWGFWAILTFLIGRRHNWARIVTLLFFVGGLALWIWDYEALLDRPPYSLAVELLDTVLTAVALYWLFTGPGAQWFRHADAPHAL